MDDNKNISSQADPVAPTNPATEKRPRTALTVIRKIFFCLRVILLSGLIFWLTQPGGRLWVLIQCDRWSTDRSLKISKKRAAGRKRIEALTKKGAAGAEDLWRILQESREWNWTIPNCFEKIGPAGVPYLMRCLKSKDPELRHVAACCIGDMAFNSQRLPDGLSQSQADAQIYQLMKHLPQIGEAMHDELGYVPRALVKLFETFGPAAKPILPDLLAYRRRLREDSHFSDPVDSSLRSDFNNATRAVLIVNPKQPGQYLVELDLPRPKPQ